MRSNRALSAFFVAAGAVFALSSLTACSDPAKDAPKAKVEEKKVEAKPAEKPAEVKPADGAGAAGAAAAAEKVLKFAPESTIGFVGAKITGKHEGGFKTFTGEIVTKGDKAEDAKIKISIVTDSLFSDAEKLTGHLKAPDFFDVAKFPEAKFESTAIKAGGENGATHTITGDLSLHGVTKQITFPAKVTVSPTEVVATSEFAINRKDFGIVYPGKPDDLIKDDVLVKFNIKAPR